MRRPWTLALVLAFSFGCKGAKIDPTSPPGYEPPSTTMTVAEAQQIVDKVRAERGLAAPGAPPATLAEVREIVRADQLLRFAAARRFAQDKTGADSLALRSVLETSWADAQLTVAEVLDELAQHKAVEIRRLEARADAGDAQARGDLQAHRTQAGALQRTRDALLVLAKPHLEAGGDLAREALRTNPNHEQSHRAAAFYYQQIKEWGGFDSMMGKLEARETPDALVDYLRGMEAIRRNIDRTRAVELLNDAIARDPGLVRVQARLVLLHEDINARHTEFEKLKTMSPSHPLIVIAGPAIEAEYAASRELGTAR